MVLLHRVLMIPSACVQRRPPTHFTFSYLQRVSGDVKKLTCCLSIVIKADLCFIIVMPSELNLGANKDTGPVLDEEVEVNFKPKTLSGTNTFLYCA